MHAKAGSSHPHRITLTDPILKNFFENIYPGTVSELATVKGLPYTLVYNLVHGRIHSLAARDYRRIFWEEPPHQEPKRVNGEFFRDMVRLWLFLHDDVTEADLYMSLFLYHSTISHQKEVKNEKIKYIHRS